jgi:hypothetical protein
MGDWWRVESLLCNDREKNKYKTEVPRQRLGKHVPAATDTNETMVQQYSNGVFCGPQRRGKHMSTVTNPDTIE